MSESNRKISDSVHHKKQNDGQNQRGKVHEKEQQVAYFPIHNRHYDAQEQACKTEERKNDCKDRAPLQKEAL